MASAILFMTSQNLRIIEIVGSHAALHMVTWDQSNKIPSNQRIEWQMYCRCSNLPKPSWCICIGTRIFYHYMRKKLSLCIFNNINKIAPMRWLQGKTFLLGSQLSTVCGNLTKFKKTETAGEYPLFCGLSTFISRNSLFWLFSPKP